jgi:hypothetical protein
MAEPKSQTEFDPSRTPFTTPAPRFTYLEHPAVYPGKLMINSDTNQVVPMPDQPYPGFPIRLPQALMDVPQPYVRTCGKPGEGNAGCDAAVGGGCPILQRYGRVGPFNLIIEKNSHVDSAPCHTVYCGVGKSGRPTSQVHYLMDGYQILTDRTVIPENIRVDRRDVVRYTEVPDLAPFYDHLKVEKPAPKKRGRPKKVQVAD